jgi:hypothetical protein
MEELHSKRFSDCGASLLVQKPVAECKKNQLALYFHELCPSVYQLKPDYRPLFTTTPHLCRTRMEIFFTFKA